MSFKITKESAGSYKVKGMPADKKREFDEAHKRMQNIDCRIPPEQQTEEQKESCRGSAKSKALKFKKGPSRQYEAAMKRADKEYEEKNG